MMSKPCMKQSRNHIDTIDEFSAFKITPSSGEFPPDSCFDFQVYSSPKQVIRNRLVLFEFSYLKETLLHKRNNACWISSFVIRQDWHVSPAWYKRYLAEDHLMWLYALQKWLSIIGAVYETIMIHSDLVVLKIGEFHSVAHLVLKKVPILNQMKNITKQEQDLTAMKIGLKISSVVNTTYIFLVGSD